jgi:hypothetical protein
MDSDNYPETCHAIYIVNGGMAFGAIWRIVSPFVDKGTRDKVHVVGSGKYMRVSRGYIHGARMHGDGGDISMCICWDMLSIGEGRGFRQGLVGSSFRTGKCLTKSDRVCWEDVRGQG